MKDFGDEHSGVAARIKPAKRGDSIKPGVERSGTPGSPRVKGRAREVGDRRFIDLNPRAPAIARFARSVFLLC